MKVQIIKEQGYKRQIYIQCNETTSDPDTVKAWLDQLKIAERWLRATAVKK